MSRSAGGVMIRYGEVFLKGRRRAYFIDTLQSTLQRRLNRRFPGYKLARPYGRFVARPLDESLRVEDPDTLSEEMAKVFGVTSAGPCELVQSPTIDRLEESVVDYTRAHKSRRHRTFKVECRRAYKDFPVGSLEMNQRLGGAINAAFDDLSVDVVEPDLTVRVEVRCELALIFGAQVRGVGGLPVGSNGRALLMLSGGIDSPVAGWLTQKRGVAIDAVTFTSPPYTGPQAREKVRILARSLSHNQKKLRLWLVPITPLQELYRDNCNREKLLLLYRRSMMRIAESIARAEGHEAIITGENLGQVASQTMQNLRCIADAVALPVLRPLLCHNKQETIELAKNIGTYETSILPYEDSCSLFVPAHPELRGKIPIVESMEARVQPTSLEADALAGCELLTFPPPKRQLDASAPALGETHRSQ